jgi:hypothetical protein
MKYTSRLYRHDDNYVAEFSLSLTRQTHPSIVLGALLSPFPPPSIQSFYKSRQSSSPVPLLVAACARPGLGAGGRALFSTFACTAAFHSPRPAHHSPFNWFCRPLQFKTASLVGSKQPLALNLFTIYAILSQKRGSSYKISFV